MDVNATETIQIITKATPETHRVVMPPECVSAMLKLRGSDRYVNLFEDLKTRKISVWGNIARELQAVGYFFSATQYAQKFINLRKLYTRYRNHLRKPGEKTMPRPRYYPEVHRILKGKLKVNQRYVNKDIVEIMRETIGNEDQKLFFTNAEEPLAQASETLVQSMPCTSAEDTDITRLLHELIKQQKESNAIMMLELQHRKETDVKMLEILERLTADLNNPF